jgi:formylglycine-generating enzyme required for sulfatase activity
MATIVIEQANRELRVAADDFPIVIGGPEAHIPIPGAVDEAPRAFVGMEASEPFLQPAAGVTGVFCNGNPLTTSQWLRNGDEVRVGMTVLAVAREGDSTRLKVQQKVTEVDTEPPIIVAAQSLVPPSEAPPEALVTPAEFQPNALRRSGRSRRIPHPLLVLTWVALGVLALAAWYLFTSRAVEVRVLPEPDQLSVEGKWLNLELGGRYLLRPGTYEVVAEKEGYRRLQTPMEVSRLSSQVHEFELEILPGLLELVTVPSAGAQVSIDGQKVGVTPLGPLELTPGEHMVVVASGRFEAVTETVQIEGGGNTVVLRVELTPLWAPVTIGSSPEGATVRIDGEEVGRTPATADVLEGGHDLELRLAGYKPYRTRLNVLANQPYSPPVIMLRPSDGQLTLTSEPAGATVSIDDEYRGQTPLEIELAPGVDHQISVSKTGYDTAGDTLRLESGRSREIHVSLDARYGEIEISSEPAGAELIVDGEAVGTANQTLRLTATPHVIEVRKEGFESHRQSLTPRPGFPQVVQVTLRTAEQVRQAARLPVVQGPQGQELRLIEPGKFRVGASRREPGRRSNETLRDVELTRAFYLATEEVSNREFHEFREEHKSGHVGQKTLDLDEYPAVEVTWNEAARYCNWLSAKEGLPPAYELKGGQMVGTRPLASGYRLPTEAEWVWAARFAGSGGGRKYPWGNSLPVAAGSGNYADTSAGGLVEGTIGGYNDGFAATAPVDSFQPNSVGIFNMGGNVAEWVHDFYQIYPSSSATLLLDPIGPEQGEYHVIRGSSWMDSTITELRLSFRDYGNGSRPDVGFRIARFVD